MTYRGRIRKITKILGLSYANLDMPDRLNEYRTATLMLLSFIVPNPKEVEDILYESLIDTNMTRGFGPDIIINGI